MSLSEDEYVRLASHELGALIDALDELTGDFEAELASDILTLEFADGAKYVINSHTAARQIWMAAERQAWHFDYDRDAQAWIAKKSSDELWQTVAAVLGKKLGKGISLPRS
jgi:CyaY protein